ncbi:uncharacterized protein LOC121049160 [Rosa chinensis]|uniref:uncharacterized protein LOC121049160 n=1 Tax=Rosa chinensis TaxID=74649 RepID=UPI001AD938E6|nr:uncharacterized protein LOC121049160 [Rosa chinensis]
MSDYNLQFIGNVSEVNDSQDVGQHTQNDDKGEEILMRMIRGDYNMTPNHADCAVNEMNASRGSVNRNIGDMRSKTGHGTRKRAGKIKKKRGKNKVNFAPYGPEKMLFNKFGQPVALAETVARFSRDRKG